MPCCDNKKEKKHRESKSKKSHSDHSEPKCCVSEKAIDCCSLPYQRLDKLRTIWATASFDGLRSSQAASAGLFTTVFNRAGDAVAVPVASIFQATDTNGIALAGTSTSAPGPATSMNNAYYGYLFVNTMRYLTYEACGKTDQVWGWLVDTSVGNLELFQNIPEDNLNMTTNLLTLSNISEENLSSTQRRQYAQLNVLYKLSLKAIEKVGANPKEEGNIVLVTDKRDRKWMLTINNANNQSSVCDVVTRFVIVGVAL